MASTTKDVAPASFSFVTPLRRGVDKGELVEVEDTLVEGLLEQGWTLAGGAKRKEMPAADAAGDSSTEER